MRKLIVALLLVLLVVAWVPVPRRVALALDPNWIYTGLDDGQLKAQGELAYPEEGVRHNRAAHRLGSKLMTDRHGPVVAVWMGVANEVWEAHNMSHTGEPYFSTTRFDFGDLAANMRGVRDSLWREDER